MKKINLQDLKSIQLEVLDAFVCFCNKNKLRYFLSCGTLLGAVRHHGYIPWDDDIDVMMPRNDYEFLIKHFNGVYEYYSLTHHSIDTNYAIAYAKVYDNRTVVVEKVNAKYKLGVNIDVFPLDGIPEDKLQREKHLSKILKLRYINDIKLSFVNYKAPWWKRILQYVRLNLYKLVSFHYVIDKIDQIAKKYEFDKSKYVALAVFPQNKKEMYDKDLFSSCVDLLFEGKKYAAPVGYAEYLEKTYGNYMQYPPKEEQETHHSFEAYFIND